MAKLWYEPKAGGTELHMWDDPQVIAKSDIESQLAAFTEIATLGDDLKTFLAQSGIPGLGIGGGYPDLASFDDYLTGEIDRLSDILDYFGYDSRVENLTVRDGAWFTPVALESVSHEEVGNEGVLAIDGNNTTYWQSNDTGLRTIVFKLRHYTKRASKIRLRTVVGDETSQLQDVTVKAAKVLDNIDDLDNIMGTLVDFTRDGNDWTEFAFPSLKNCQYIKLEVATSLAVSSNRVRIREIDAWVGIINHDK